ncbi:hypothetical protein UlMin_018224 [Ulmus minor]
MAERKLNFNAPLLSVRRFSTTSASLNGEKAKVVESPPPYRRRSLPPEPSFNLEQVTEPGAVPFNWEQIPGQAKHGKAHEPQTRDRDSPVTPRFPPRMVSEARRQSMEMDYACKNGFRSPIRASSFNHNAVESRGLREGLEDEEEDVYSDALETLSSNESASLDCSASGLSGGSDVKPSGTFLTDPQTRDFMMMRFLPAAKAMALEPPRYAAKKQPAAPEQPKEARKMVCEIKKPLLDEKRSSLSSASQYIQYQEEEESDEDEVEDYNEPGSITAKGCGFFPRLCLRNSLSILSPIAGMKIKNRSRLSCSSTEVAKPNKTAQNHSQTKPSKKHVWNASHKQKSDRISRSGELQVVENKWVGDSRRFTYSGELPRSRLSSSPLRHSRSSSISPYRNRPSQSPFRERGFLGTPKEENVKANDKSNLYNKTSNKFQEAVTNEKNKPRSFKIIPAIEKTLYVDTVNNAAKSSSKSGCLDSKAQLRSSGEEFKHLVEPKGEKETGSESLFRDIACLSLEGDKLEPEGLGSVDDKSSLPKLLLLSNQVVSEVGFGQDLVTNNENLDKGGELILKEDSENVNSSLVPSPLPPPLPKSPSESWLWRTIPSISLRNPISSMSFGAKMHTKKLESKTSSASIKWETIVKSSKLHHDHARYSEELVARVSQQSKYK